MKTRYDATVYGKVQRVGFRAYCRRSALALGLTGWVRNLPDGSVEITAVGERRALEIFAGLVSSGSPHSRVDHVDVIWSTSTGNEPDGFVAR